MSTLSRRLARFRESGNAPRGRSAGGGPGPGEPDGKAKQTKPDRIDLLRKRRHAAGISGTSRPPAAGASKVEADSRPPGNGWRMIGDFVWERRLEYDVTLPAVYPDPLVLPENTPARELCFYDLETTGLSGGAGNTAFLIGAGRLCSAGLEVRQFFLADYPGEEELLHRYSEYVGTGGPLVSFNGRSFDSQVLRTRFLLNRMVPSDSLEVDLLYPARRFWKSRLPDTTLRTMETAVLDFHRVDDLPGSEAPDAWFEWLAGDSRRIEGVFRHNADDIVTLARLLGRMEEWGGIDPGASMENQVMPDGAVPSCWGMALQWSSRDESREYRWLEEGHRRGERRCGLELARRCRREGRIEKALAIWEEMDLRGSDYAVLVELAKYREHRERNPRRALDTLASLTDMDLSDRQRRDLDHRLRRLEYKIRRTEDQFRDRIDSKTDR